MLKTSEVQRYILQTKLGKQTPQTIMRKGKRQSHHLRTSDAGAKRHDFTSVTQAAVVVNHVKL